MRKHQRASARRSGHSQGLALEALEPRQLLSMSASMVARTWVINGDANPASLNDVIDLTYDPSTQKFNLTINGGAVQSRPLASVRSIIINGGKGDDTITVNTNGKSIPVTINGGTGNDNLTGGDGNDTINGGAGDDTINGGAGNDYINGGAGNDILIGGTGRDVITGGAGTDTIYGVKGTDTIYKDKTDSIVNSEQPNSSGGTGDGTGTGGGGGGIIVNPLPPVWNPSPIPSQPFPAPTATISDALWLRLVDEAVARNESLFGTTYTQGPYMIAYDSGAVTLVANSPTIAAASAGNVTGTNDQVSGVDEADFVKTDGNCIYRLSGNQLTIVDVSTPASPKILSTTQFSGNAVGLYLANGRVVVLTDYPRFYPLGYFNTLLSGALSFNSSNQVDAWVYDVSDPANVKLTEKTSFIGTLAASRMVGNQVYLVLQNYLSLPGPMAYVTNGITTINPDGTSSTILPGSNGDPAQYQYQTEAQYRQWLEDNKNSLIPYFATTLADGSAGNAGSIVDAVANAADGGTLGSVSSVIDLDMTQNTGPAAKVTVPGNANVVYATQQTMYLFGQTSSVALLANPQTTVTKISLGADSVGFVDAGQITGTPLNSYSIDEYNGQLRVVTSWTPPQTATGPLSGIPGFTQTHTLYVLTDTGTALAITGELDNVGDGEDLRSVLFVQDRAFVVTFRQVDPLFAIDLSDPANPVSAGQLVMPGYSTYLYAIDRDHLIGIGAGQDPSNPTWYHTLQVSLYDVADLSNPIQEDQRLYTGGWVSSAAQYDPHAFSYFADQGVLAIPKTGGTGSNSTDLVLLKVDPATGFTDLGEVVNQTPVQESLRIGDNLYSIGTGDMKIVQLLNPTNVIADVTLPGSLVLNPGGPIFLPPIGILLPIEIGINPITVIPIETLNPGGVFITGGTNLPVTGTVITNGTGGALDGGVLTINHG